MLIERKARSNQNLTQGSTKQALISMTIPMIVGMIMLFTFSLVDTFFVSLLGSEALTAISFTFPVTFSVMSMAIGLGIGASAVVAKNLGSDNAELAKQAATTINYVSFLLAIVLAFSLAFIKDSLFKLMGAQDALLPLIQDYMNVWLPGSVLIVCLMTGNSILRACGDTKTPSMLMAGAGLANAVLDPILIFGLGPVPSLGIAGAAYATVIAWGISIFFLFYHLVYRLKFITFIPPVKADFINSAKDMLKIGVPAAGANMMTPLATGIMTGIAAGFGNEAVSALGVGARLEPLATLIILAMSSSLPPIVSQNFGAGEFERIESVYKLAIRFIVGWQLLVYIALFFAADPIAGIFSDDQNVRDTIVLYLSILPLAYGFQGIIILTNSSLNAIHRPMTALYLSIARFFLFYVPFAFIGSQLYGIQGFFIGAASANFCMAAISLRTFQKVFQTESKISASSKTSL
ncbi:MAG: MATE family efflux transporter [Gammaproteobacteria bacterium]|nr:MATE family efflux transporter [Gammaproteobacteria bacterium]MDG2118443.1 MATE family efflux transporter [Gammaproteobacteria bacterium]